MVFGSSKAYTCSLVSRTADVCSMTVAVAVDVGRPEQLDCLSTRCKCLFFPSTLLQQAAAAAAVMGKCWFKGAER